jgi:cytochrome c-type biogenesis protein CcmH
VRKFLCFALVLCLATGLAWAADTPHTFTDPAQQVRYEYLLNELRCLVCQNQSLADSHADLAQDLRDEVYRMVTAGEDEAAVLRFMVARYGDFVLYRPVIKPLTWSLWFGPLGLFVIVAILWWRIQRRSRQALVTPLSADEQQRLTALLPSAGPHDNPP